MSNPHRAALLPVLLSVSFGAGVQPPQPQSAPPDLRCTASDDGFIDVTINSRPMLRYRAAGDIFKPYLRELRTPAGINVMADSPPDHVHHHGLMFAIGAAETDFWGEEPPEQMGRQVPQGPADTTADDSSAGLAQRLAWTAPDGRVLLREDRSIRALAAGQDLGATLITWHTTLTALGAEQPVPLWGRHYFGLGMRLAPDLEEACTFLHAARTEGRIYRGDERLTPGRWCAAQGSIDGHPITVAVFDHPLNPRHPATWFTMAIPFAYVAATPNLEAQPRVLAPGQTFDLRYGVAVWDAHTDSDTIESVYRAWVHNANPLAARTNVALAENGTTALASSAYGPAYTADKAIDGRWRIRETDKWNSAANVTPHYLRLDFARPRLIDTIVIRHEGALPIEGAFQYNTSDYRLQRSDRPWGPWRDFIPPVHGNTDNVSIHRFDPVTTRYIRLLIETGEQNGRNEYGRITELEVYSPHEP